MTIPADLTAASGRSSGDAGPARLIVCEQSGRWAVRLRSEWGEGVRVHQTRSLAECFGELAASPAALLVIELSAAGVDDLLRRLARIERDFPRCRVAIVADRELAAYEWLLREAGAVYFTCSPRQLGLLARIAARHLAGVPAPAQSLAERIWASLPWQQREQRRSVTDKV